jgi:hypothetical protein
VILNFQFDASASRLICSITVFKSSSASAITAKKNSLCEILMCGVYGCGTKRSVAQGTCGLRPTCVRNGAHAPKAATLWHILVKAACHRPVRQRCFQTCGQWCTKVPRPHSDDRDAVVAPSLPSPVLTHKHTHSHRCAQHHPRGHISRDCETPLGTQKILLRTQVRK